MVIDHTVRYVIADADTAEYMVQTDPDCLLETVGDMFYLQGYSFFLRQGSQITTQVSSAVLKLRENLELDNIKRDIWNDPNLKCANYTTSLDGDVDSLTAEQMSGIFVIAFFAILISLAIYLALRYSGTSGDMREDVTRPSGRIGKTTMNLLADLSRRRSTTKERTRQV